MASDVTLAEHHAREQIARTLPDGLQQMLVIAALNLEQQLKHDAEGAPRRRAAFRGKAPARRGDLRRAIAELRVVPTQCCSVPDCPRH
jgi:signal transduction histidine kinase